jgi:DNA-binding SARP family transcriptional activator
MDAMVRLLGPVDVIGPAGEVRLGGPKERCLLSVLATPPDRVVAEDRLIDALWDGDPPRTSSKTLQNYVLRLRRRLGSAAIVTCRPGYKLTTIRTDVSAARASIVRGRRDAALGNHDAAIDAFDEALALWRGPALAEFADRPFARCEAASLEELRATTIEERTAALLAGGSSRDVVADCEGLVAEEPLRERRWTQLMLALYREGRQGEALEAYRRLSGLLADELGIDPGPEARALHAAVLAHDPTLLAPTPPSGPAPRPTTTACVGRATELGALLEHLDDAVDGRARVALLSGEPGIGKTRLLTELAACAAARGAHVLAGRCPEGAGALPYHPFAEALETCLDGAPAPEALRPLAHGDLRPGTHDLQPDEVRARLLDGTARFLTARSTDTPVVLVVDDLHWADEGTVAMLRHVARHALGHRVLIVGAYRASEVTGGHPLTEALGALCSETTCTVIGLDGLDPESMAQLVSATAGAPASPQLVEAITAETGGNPLFARELVSHLREDRRLHATREGTLEASLPLSAVPEGVRHVIGRRRRRLTARTNRLLDIAAVVEGPFPFDPVRRAAGLSESEGLLALDAALQADLVMPAGAPDRYEFTHALIRHAIHRELNPSRRLRLHRELAVALGTARRAGVRIGAGEVAIQYHHAASLPGTAAGVAPAVEAADRARSMGAHDERAAFLQVALDLLPTGDDRRAGLLARRADALAWALRFDEAVDDARAAVAAGSGLATRAELATVLAAAGSTTHAWLLAAEATATAGHVDRVSRAALTLLDLERREAADPDHPGMPLDLAGRRAALGILHESGRLARRGDLARYALAAVHGRRDRIPAAAADDPTVAAFLMGDYARAVPGFERDADAAEADGRLAWAVYCRAGQARCQVALGAITDAVVLLEHVRTLLTRLPGLPLGWQLLHHEGAEDALVTALDEGWPERLDRFARWMRPAPERHWGSAGITSIGARGRARMGETDEALRLLGRPVLALHRAPAWAPNYARTAYEVAETMWLLDRRDHLAVVEHALRDRALPADFRFPMTDSRLALARLCALDGRPAEASRWFDAARDVLEAQSARPLRAVVDHDEAVMHLRRGERAAAERWAAGAAAQFERLGMSGWTRRLSRAMGWDQTGGDRPRPRCDLIATVAGDPRTAEETTGGDDHGDSVRVRDRHDDRG